MTRTVAVELRRFAARRAVRMWLLVALAAVVVVNVVQLGRATATVSGGEPARVTRIPAACVVSRAEPVRLDRDCVFRRNPGVLLARDPTSLGAPPRVDVLLVQRVDRRPRVGATFERTIRGTAMALVVLALVLGATFLGADYGTSLGTQLVFEPRRRLVFAAKWLAAGIATAAVAALVLVAAGAAQWAISALRGSTAGVDAAWLGRRGVDVGRASAACGLAAMLALAIGVFTRRTVGTVVGLFGLLIGVRFLAFTAWGRTVVRLTPTNSLWAIAFGQLRTENREFFGGLRTLAGAWVLALAWTAIGLVLGATWFERQEIR